MRRIVVSNIVSLDGYFEGPNTGVMDLNMDAFFDAHNLECFEAADTVLVGATSYQGFSGYWPFVEQHEDVPPDHPMARAFDDTNRRISRSWNTKPVVVVSDGYRVADDGPWASHTTVIRRDEVARWNQAGDEDVIVFGRTTSCSSTRRCRPGGTDPDPALFTLGIRCAGSVIADSSRRHTMASSPRS